MEKTKPSILGESVRKDLAAFLRPERSEIAISLLESLVTPNRRSLPEFIQYEKPQKIVKPTEVQRRLETAIRALRRLAEVVPFNEREITQLCIKRLELQRDEFLKRKPDSRSEYLQMLCSYIGLIWNWAALNPKDKLRRRHFATIFLNHCGINHPAEEHPKRVDHWLDQQTCPGWSVVTHTAIQEIIHDPLPKN